MCVFSLLLYSFTFLFFSVFSFASRVFVRCINSDRSTIWNLSIICTISGICAWGIKWDDAEFEYLSATIRARAVEPIASNFISQWIFTISYSTAHTCLIYLLCEIPKLFAASSFLCRWNTKVFFARESNRSRSACNYSSNQWSLHRHLGKNKLHK